MTEDHAAFLGDIPRNYDEGLGPNIFDHYGQVMAARIAACDPQDVLEIAAGSGIVTRHIRDALDSSASLTATDLNAPMLEIAKGKFGPDEAVAFQTADAQALSFDDASFDVVATQFGHMFFPDRPRAYAQAARVLRPGGTMIFSTWGSHQENPFSKISHSVLAELFEGNPPTFYATPFSMNDPAVVLDELAAAGFKDARHEAAPHVREILDHTLFAQGLIYGNPAIDEVRNRSGDAEAVRDELAIRLRAKFGDEPAPMPLLAHFFTVRP